MRLSALACLLPLSLTFAAPALAENAGRQCDTRKEMLSTLSEEYGEEPMAVGQHINGGTIELLSQGGDGTWSLIVTSPEGWSCLLAAGESWRELRIQQSRNPTPAE